MNRKLILVISALVLLTAILLMAGWRSMSDRVDPEVARIQTMQQQLFQRRDDERLNDDQRAEHFRSLRNEFEKLNDQQRQQVREGMRELFASRMQANIKEFRTLTGNERTAFLDEQIDRMERRTARMDGRGREGVRGDRAPRGGSRQQREGRRRRSASEEERNDRRRARMDRTSPEQRAEFTAYFEALRQRRKERGLPDRGFRFGPR